MKQTIRFHIALALLLASSLLFGCQQSTTQQVEPYEAWFVLKMGGQRAGYMHTEMKQEGDTLVSTSETVIAIKRGDAEIRIDQSSSFVESLDYQPISSESSMKFATMATQQRVDFGGEKWTMTSTNAGQQTTTEIAPPTDDWLTPGELAKTMEEAFARGDQDISVSTLDLSMGTRPITINMKRGEREDVEVFGKVIPATRWTTSTTATPGIEIVQWTDEAGQPVRQTIPLMPGMGVEMLLADEQLAKAQFDAPEMLAASLIEPDKRIKNPRTLKRGVFDIKAAGLKGDIGDAIPNDGFQRTAWIDDDTLRITVDLDKPVTQESQKIDAAYRAASSMLNHEDEVIRDYSTKLLKHMPRVRGKGKEYIEHQETVSETLRLFVRRHIDAKDLSVGFASASEVARTKQGDCTEHACLLAAMLRAADLPARAVTGLVYADQFAGREGVFGFHMWTQVWIKTGKNTGYWLDLDAAAPGKVNGFDATHIALATSPLSDDESFNGMVTLLPLMQGMEIKVVKTEWAE